MVLLCMVEGILVLEEIIFENCFMYVFELVCMGVWIEVYGGYVIVYGVVKMCGVLVMVIDLCVLVSLIFVGFVVEGEIIVSCVYYFDCGYEKVVCKLCGVGVDIECIKELVDV